MGLLSSLLSHPLTRGMDLDDPRTTELRKQILRSKPFLRKLYQQWYRRILESLPRMEGTVLELGTGPGFLREHIPGLITSDILPVTGCDLCCSALALPFADRSLRAIVMINVLHHLPDADGFFRECARSLQAGGRVIMIEPWVSPWSRFVYSKLHHEPFDPAAPSWKLPESGPLSGGNDALPWIVFARDREVFATQCTPLRIISIKPGYPASYLLSGGMSLRNLVPGCMSGPMSCLEDHLPKFLVAFAAMFALIVLERTERDLGDACSSEP